MKEAVILQSPHAVDPMETLTEKEPENGWRVSRVWVNGCRIVSVETLFFQPLSDFQMDLFACVSLRMELVRGGDAGMTRYKSLRTELRLRYSLNLRPCKLTCRFVKTVVKEEDGLLARNPWPSGRTNTCCPFCMKATIPAWRAGSSPSMI